MVKILFILDKMDPRDYTTCLIFNYCLGHEIIHHRQSREFSFQAYSMVCHGLDPREIKVPSAAIYKQILDEYWLYPERFPEARMKLALLLAYCRATRFVRSSDWINTVAKHLQVRLPSPLGDPEEWLMKQYYECEISEVKQQQRLKFAKDFYSDTILNQFGALCFTGEIILKTGAKVIRKGYDIFEQRGGNKKVLIFLAMHLSVGVIGPYCFELANGKDGISAEEYVTTLKTKVLPELKAKIGPERFEEVVFQQNGRGYQEDKISMSYLESVFGKRVISRGTTVSWPKYYKDLNPVDYCFATALMRSLAKRKSVPNTIREIEAFLVNFMQNREQKFFRRAVGNFSGRTNVVIEHEGDQFEHLYSRFHCEFSLRVTEIELGRESLASECLDCTLCGTTCECLNLKSIPPSSSVVAPFKIEWDKVDWDKFEKYLGFTTDRTPGSYAPSRFFVYI